MPHFQYNTAESADRRAEQKRLTLKQNEKAVAAINRLAEASGGVHPADRELIQSFIHDHENLEYFANRNTHLPFYGLPYTVRND